jgi:transcriptional regulator with XRE-family HTH domain
MMDIRQTRRALNLTQTQLAEMTGLSIGTILRAEKSGLITAKNYRLITDKLKDYAQSISFAISTSSNTSNTPIF